MGCEGREGPGQPAVRWEGQGRDSRGTPDSAICQANSLPTSAPTLMRPGAPTPGLQPWLLARPGGPLPTSWSPSLKTSSPGSPRSPHPGPAWSSLPDTGFRAHDVCLHQGGLIHLFLPQHLEGLPAHRRLSTSAVQASVSSSVRWGCCVPPGRDMGELCAPLPSEEPEKGL